MSAEILQHQADRRAEIERKLLARLACRTLPRIPQRDPVKPAPLSFGQERMWLFSRLYPQSTAGNFVFRYQLAGTLHVSALRQALGTIQARHEVLRTVFRDEQQIVLDPGPADLVIHDLRGTPERASAILQEAAAEPFDLGRRPPIRWHLLVLGEERHELIMCLHHVASDGWSEAIIDRELAALYAAYLRGGPDPLPPLRVQYADYAAWQRDMYRGEEKSVLWWRSALEGASPVTELPIDRPAAADTSYDAAWVTRYIPRQLADQLAELCAQENSTPFMGLLAIFAAVLSRLCGQEDLVIGAPVAGRQLPELEQLVGFFINTIAVRVDASGEPGLRTLLSRVRSATLGAYEHQDVPLDLVIERLRPPRYTGRAPIVQVLFQVYNVPEYKLELPGLTVLKEQHLSAGGSALDLTLSVAAEPDEQGLGVLWEYRKALFESATIEMLHACLISVLSQAVAAPDVPLAQMPLLPGRGDARVAGPGAGLLSPADQQPVHERIARIARAHPDAIAISDREGQLTYSDLDEGVGVLAARLSAAGVRPGDLVGICLPRSRHLVTAVLGALKAGAAYLPLDPAHPAERLARIVGDARPSAVLCDAASAAHVAGCAVPLLRVDEPAAPVPPPCPVRPAAHPADLAYVIYTSGSTGQPKGVAVSHAALASYLRQAAAAYDPDAALDWILLSPLAFDFTVTPLFVPLLAGRTIIVLGDQDPLGDLAAVLTGPPQAPYAVKLTPAHLAALRDRLAAGRLANAPALVVVGGDQLLSAEASSWRELAPYARLINEYGPTEATVGCVIHQAGDDPLGRPVVPIGQPIPGMRAYVLDSHLNPMPPGGTGELYLAGAGIARGYLRKPALTAQSFLPDPFAGTAGAVMYRTGDLARQRPDGLLEFLGRGDRQVKIRGYRAEPAEAEAALLNCPGVTQAAVVVRRDGEGEPSLVAYVVGDQALEPSALRARVSEALPAPLVPSAFVQLAGLPVTSNGKLDHTALPSPGRGDTGTAAPLTPPATNSERVIAEVWRAALALDEVGTADDFFGLGGHSLLATAVAGKVAARLDVDSATALRALFSAPTIAGMAAALDSAVTRRPGGDAAALAPEGPVPLTFSQEGLWLVDQLTPESCEYLVPMAWWLDGPVDEAALRTALAAVVERHEVLRMAFPEQDGRPAGRLLDPSIVTLDVVAADDPEELLMAQVSTPIDIKVGPPLRALLARVGESRRLLCLTVHHIVMDGWSQDILLRDLDIAYQAAVSGCPVSWPPLPLSFAKHAALERAPQRQQERQLSLDHWERVLRGAPDLDLPSDRPRPRRRRGAGGAVTFEAEPNLVAAIDSLQRSHAVTPLMVLGSALLAFLHQWTGSEDITIGVSAGGRPDPATQDLIGFFVTMLAIRADLSGNPSFTELLGVTRGRMLDALAHQDVSFPQVVERLGRGPDLSRTPVFQVSLEYAESQGHPRRLGAAVLSPCSLPVTIAKYDLTLGFLRDGSRLFAELEFDRDLFEEETAARIAEAFTGILSEAVRNPGSRLRALPAPAGVGRYWPEAHPGPARAARPPRTDAERVMAAIFEEVLSAQGIGAEDDFFALGGQSLMAVQVVALMRKSFGTAFPLDLLFKYPTVAAAAAEVERIVTEEILAMPDDEVAALLPAETSERNLT